MADSKKLTIMVSSTVYGIEELLGPDIYPPDRIRL